METSKSTGNSLIEFQHGLSLDEAKLVNLERKHGKIKGHLAQVVQTLQQLVIAQTQTQNQPQPQARVHAPRRREVVEYEAEPSSQDEESEDQNEEEKQPRKRNPKRRWNQEPKDDSKTEISEFDGKTQGDELLEWLLNVEHVFELKKYAVERKVKLVAIKLKCYASLWWENL